MSRARPRVQISVAGAGTCSRATARLAHAVGREVARAGAALVCGGLGGAMEAAARGAAEAGGLVVGLLPGYDRRAGNRYLTVAVPTGLGHARNVLVAAAGDAVIAVPGAAGTLSEVALARVLGRPVVGLGAWSEVPGVVAASDPAEAVRRAIALAGAGYRRRGEGALVPPRRRRLRRSGMALIRKGRSISQ
jgi:uncharacterized protein (TIGR00725 family)